MSVQIRKLLLSYYLSSLSMHQSCTSSSLLQAVLSNKLGIGLISQSLESIPNLFLMMLKKMWWQQILNSISGLGWRNFPWPKEWAVGWFLAFRRPVQDSCSPCRQTFHLCCNCMWIRGRRNKCYRPSGCCNWISGSPLNGRTETLDNLYNHIVTTAYKGADLKEKLHIRNVLQVLLLPGIYVN